MTSKRSFTPAQMEDIFDNSNGKCYFCHKKLVYGNFEKGDRGAWHCDHLIPFSRGGVSTVANGVAACFSCNSKKSDSTHTEFVKNYGGKKNVDGFVRCHGINVDGKRCSNQAQVKQRQTLYCKVHEKQAK